MHSLRRGDLCRHVWGFTGVYIGNHSCKDWVVFKRPIWAPVEHYEEWTTSLDAVTKYWTKVPEYEEV